MPSYGLPGQVHCRALAPIAPPTLQARTLVGILRTWPWRIGSGSVDLEISVWTRALVEPEYEARFCDSDA
ncbi:hypothetical protein GCM10010411_95990 [Actinomadura fulvescens]|uniref:Uncharacterized protein n=1 Tax=Actinomadura fulvescens TaxID=46160 RepID=A0ABP6DBJ1_9ACTN